MFETACPPALAAVCLSPPPAGAGVCRVCHGPAACHGATVEPVCRSCRLVTAALGMRPPPVVPLSLSAPGTEIYDVLVRYKSSRFPDTRRRLRREMAELLAWFVALHARCVSSALPPFDLVATVPSTRPDRRNHPLDEVVRASSVLAHSECVLLRRGSGRLGHLRARRDGFNADGDVARRGVLVIDDTFTSGARAMSAAAAIERAGGHVVAIVPLARVVHPERDAAAGRIWSQADPLIGFGDLAAPCCSGSCWARVA